MTWYLGLADRRTKTKKLFALRFEHATLFTHTPITLSKTWFFIEIAFFFFLNLAQVPEKDNLIYVATQKVEDKNVLVTIYN